MKNIIISLGLMFLVMTTGCSRTITKGNVGGETTLNTMSMSADSLGRNFKIVESGAIGTSKGLKILFFTFSSPSKLKANKNLRNQLRIKGKSVIFINTIEEFDSNSYFLFGYPTITIMTDVIEYTD